MNQETSADQPQWRRGCESGACIEVALHDDAVLIRSSAAPDRAITVTPDEWHAFLVAAKTGAFDGLDAAA